jgi:hypothetical protein
MSNDTFAHQSGTLYLTYYLLQIMIYRPFIPPPCCWSSQPCHAPHPHPHEDFPFPATALVVNAAKSLVRIVDTLGTRGPSDVPIVAGAANSAAAVMIMNAWHVRVQDRAAREEDVKPPPPPVQPVVDELMANAEKMFAVLEKVQDRWENVGPML